MNAQRNSLASDIYIAAFTESSESYPTNEQHSFYWFIHKLKMKWKSVQCNTIMGWWLRAIVQKSKSSKYKEKVTETPKEGQLYSLFLSIFYYKSNELHYITRKQDSSSLKQNKTKPKRDTLRVKPRCWYTKYRLSLCSSSRAYSYAQLFFQPHQIPLSLDIQEKNEWKISLCRHK